MVKTEGLHTTGGGKRLGTQEKMDLDIDKMLEDKRKWKL